jgi:cytochrome c556
MPNIFKVALGLVAGLALTVAFEAHSQQAAAGGNGYRPTATLKEVMDSLVAPSAQVLWDAVGVEVTSSGTLEKAPKTDEDWAKVRWSAVTLLEATNVVQIPGRPVDVAGATSADPASELGPKQIEARINSDRAAWVEHAHALYDAVMESVRAIDAKDVDALSEAGGTLDEACENCHLQFWYPPQK